MPGVSIDLHRTGTIVPLDDITGLPRNDAEAQDVRDFAKEQLANETQKREGLRALAVEQQEAYVAPMKIPEAPALTPEQRAENLARIKTDLVEVLAGNVEGADALGGAPRRKRKRHRRRKPKVSVEPVITDIIYKDKDGNPILRMI